MDENTHNGDESLLVKFYKDAVHMKAASDKAGHPVFEDRDFISIIIPGDATQSMEREVTERDKQRFWKQWQRYENNQGEEVEGWRVEQWPAITPGEAQALKHSNFLTVEQIANASDTQCKSLMGGMTLRAKAKAALEQAKDSAAVEKYAAENVELKSRIDALEEEIKRIGSSKRGAKAA